MMRYGYDYSAPGPMMGGGSLGIIELAFGLLVFAGIVLLIVWAVRQMSHPGGHMGGQQPPPAVTPRDEACEIARARYAKGEITKEQYEEVCKTLGV